MAACRTGDTEAIVCLNDGLFYWSIYTSLGPNELLFTSLFRQSFVLCSEREQASTQVTILILQLQVIFGSGKKGFQGGSFVMKLLLPIQVHISADRIFCTTEMTMNLVSYVKSCQEACDIKMMLPTIMNGRNQCIKNIVLHYAYYVVYYVMHSSKNFITDPILPPWWALGNGEMWIILKYCLYIHSVITMLKMNSLAQEENLWT